MGAFAEYFFSFSFEYLLNCNGIFSYLDMGYAVKLMAKCFFVFCFFYGKEM